MRGAAPRRFKSTGQAQTIVTAHAAVSNLFNSGRHLIRADHYRVLDQHDQRTGDGKNNISEGICTRIAKRRSIAFRRVCYHAKSSP